MSNRANLYFKKKGDIMNNKNVECKNKILDADKTLLERLLLCQEELDKKIKELEKEKKGTLTINCNNTFVYNCMGGSGTPKEVREMLKDIFH